jgi:Ca2+-binding EF-hand superfamily protein
MVSSIGSQSASSWASSLFSKIDTRNQGYIEKSDLQAAFAKIDKTGNAGAESTDVDAVFKELDGDSDGKVTKDEMSSALEKLAGELNAQFDQSRVRGGMKSGGGMPPPPPGGAGPAQGSGNGSVSEAAGTDASYIAAADTNGDGTVSAEELAAYQASGETSSATSAASGSGQESTTPAFGSMPPRIHGAQDAGFTKDELLSQLDELDASDSRRSSLLSSLVENFDAADTDGDGKINRMEARSHDKSSRSGEVSAQESGMMKIMQLLRAYSVDSESTQAGASTLSITA